MLNPLEIQQSQKKASPLNENGCALGIVRIRLVKVSTLAILALALQGCGKTTVPYYEPLILPLDDKSELHISTYPSDIARTVSGIPFVWKERATPNSVYFQIHVREVGKAGPNPHVESISIHSFSYAFPAHDSVQMIADYPHSFWMQDSPDYNPGGSSPVPIHDDWYVYLEIDLTLNGKRYLFHERVEAAKRERVRPLMLELFR